MKAYCLFEQSGTFKNEFKKLGIDVNWNQIEAKRKRFEARWKEAQNDDYRKT